MVRVLLIPRQLQAGIGGLVGGRGGSCDGLEVKRRQCVTSFDFAGSHQLRKIQNANLPRRLLRVDIGDSRVGRAKVNADDVATGCLVDKRIKRRFAHRFTHC